MSRITHYDILEVSPDATKDEIRAAYKAGLKITHPDRNGGKGAHLFDLIQKAWQVLSDDKLRAEYDASLRTETAEPKNADDFFADEEDLNWGQEEAWDEPVSAPIAEDGSSSKTGGGYGVAGTVVPQPCFSAEGTSWFNKPQLSLPEEYIPTPKKLLIPILLTIAFLVVEVLVFFSVPQDVRILAVAFALPAISLIPYAIRWKKATWKNSVAPFILLAAGFVALLGKQVMRSGSGTEFLISALFILGFLVLPFVTAHQWRSVVDRQRLLKDSFTMEEAQIKVLGKPGEGLVEALDKFGRANVDLGILGEQLTGDVLEELLVIPGVRVIHGLKFPGSEKADVDHAVVYGRKIAFIDSKMWKPGKYSWNNRGEIVKDTGYRDLETITHFPTAVHKYANLLPEAEVGGFMLIHPNQHGSIEVDNTFSSAANHVALGDAQQALDSIGAWFLQDNPSRNLVDRHLLNRLWRYKQ